MKRQRDAANIKKLIMEKENQDLTFQPKTQALLMHKA